MDIKTETASCVPTSVLVPLSRGTPRLSLAGGCWDKCSVPSLAAQCGRRSKFWPVRCQQEVEGPSPQGCPSRVPFFLLPGGRRGGVGTAAVLCLADPEGLGDRSWKEPHSQRQHRASVPAQASDLRVLCRKERNVHDLCFCYFGVFSFCYSFFVDFLPEFGGPPCLSVSSCTRPLGSWMWGLSLGPSLFRLGKGAEGAGRGKEGLLAGDSNDCFSSKVFVKLRRFQVWGLLLVCFWSWAPGSGVCTGHQGVTGPILGLRVSSTLFIFSNF